MPSQWRGFGRAMIFQFQNHPMIMVGFVLDYPVVGSVKPMIVAVSIVLTRMIGCVGDSSNEISFEPMMFSEPGHLGQ